MNEIRQIVYMSTALPKFTQSDIERILHFARARNKLRDVTGLLVYGDGNIIQAIEGEPETIGALFESIRRDSRHTNIIKVVDLMMMQRDFPDWRMAFAKAPDKKRVKECLDLLKSKQQLIDELSGKGIAGSVLLGFVDRVVAG